MEQEKPGTLGLYPQQVEQAKALRMNAKVAEEHAEVAVGAMEVAEEQAELRMEQAYEMAGALGL